MAVFISTGKCVPVEASQTPTSMNLMTHLGGLYAYSWDCIADPPVFSDKCGLFRFFFGFFLKHAITRGVLSALFIISPMSGRIKATFHLHPRGSECRIRTYIKCRSLDADLIPTTTPPSDQNIAPFVRPSGSARTVLLPKACLPLQDHQTPPHLYEIFLS